MAESSNTKADVIKAAALLKEGEVVAFPTETVYGLGASIFSPSAIEKIFAIKRRPSDNPLIIHIAHFSQLELIVDWYPDAMVKRFWPGPLTLLLPKKASVPDLISAGEPLVGVRMPAHPLARELIERAGPLAAPSANLSGRPSSTTAEHVREDFGDKVFILDGGPCLCGLESTVLRLNPPTILRPGSVSREELEAFMGVTIDAASGQVEKPLSPGMKYKHYAPKAKVHLIYPNNLKNWDSREFLHQPKSNSSGCLGIHEEPKAKSGRFIIRELAPENLYALLRLADERGYEEIFILLNPQIQSDPALMDRLIRAAE